MRFSETPTTSTLRRVFATWSIEVPDDFDETFVDDGSYWHAWTDDRSISMTSMTITEGSRPVPAALIFREMTKAFEGQETIDTKPPDLLACAIFDESPSLSRASRLLSGLVASDGRALLVTITSDDRGWAQRTWQSIRRTSAAPGELSQAMRQIRRPRSRRRPTCAGRRTPGP